MGQLTLADKYKLQRDEFMSCSVRKLVYDMGRMPPSLLPDCRNTMDNFLLSCSGLG